MTARPLARITLPVLEVLAIMLNGDGWYGFRIAEATALGSGTVYPILARLEQAGWLTGTWEATDGPEARNDPGARRKYYSFTADGRERATAALRARTIRRQQHGR